MAASGCIRPKVGVVVFVTSKHHLNSIIIGRRKGKIGGGTYAAPGGHLEFGESWEDCGRRELLEETGLKLSSIKFGTAINVVWTEGSQAYHYVDIVMVGELDVDYKPEPENTEPDKCEGWEWHDWDKFPPHAELFSPLQQIRDSGYNPFKQ